MNKTPTGRWRLLAVACLTLPLLSACGDDAGEAEVEEVPAPGPAPAVPETAPMTPPVTPPPPDVTPPTPPPGGGALDRTNVAPDEEVGLGGGTTTVTPPGGDRTPSEALEDALQETEEAIEQVPEEAERETRPPPTQRPPQR